MRRVISPIACLLALSSCSYEYEVKASVSGGKLIFDANPQWGADCVRDVEVSAEGSGGRTETIWQQAVSHDQSCENKFPIAFGATLKGDPFFNARIVAAGGYERERGFPHYPPAKKLRVGAIYTIHTTTGSTGYGCGRFRINENYKVQNIGCH